jgi:hypothetical protein
VAAQARLKSHVETRAKICERWLATWRALVRHQYEEQQTKERRDLIGERLRLMYRPDLSTLRPPEQTQLSVILEALIDFESWDRIRERHSVSIEAACDVWMKAIDRMLPPTPSP